MARNREKKGSLTFQLKTLLDSKLAIGTSKHTDKQLGATSDKIYSWATYKAYLKHGVYFLDWAKANYGVKTLEQASPFINEWLESRENQNLSAYTVKLEASALAKIYSLPADEIYKSKSRLRADIQRSRGEKVRDKHFSATAHQELIRFCQATGLRRAELTQLKGTDLIYINSEPFIHISRASKGGRPRNIPLKLDTAFIIDFMVSAGDNKVFSTVPNGADIHSYRAEFATNYYNSIARDVSELPKDEKYICRKDLKGIVYDRQAMLEVSRALGHNRVNIIASHYIRR